MTAKSLGLALLTITVVACGHTPTGPTQSDLTGTWMGSGSYPNAPFQVTLSQTGTALRGSYFDRHDRSISVTGTVQASTVVLAVDFGDAQIHFEASVENARSIRGTMRTSALGNNPYAFTMTR